MADRNHVMEKKSGMLSVQHLQPTGRMRLEVGEGHAQGAISALTAMTRASLPSGPDPVRLTSTVAT